MKYSKMLDEMYMNKQANEDDDKDVVCNNCGKPMNIKNGPGCCTCNGGKGTSTKKEFLENELAKKLASEVLDDIYKEAKVDADEFRKSIKDAQKRLDNVGSRIDNAVKDANKSVAEAVKDYSKSTGAQNTKATINSTLQNPKGISKGLKRAGLIGAGVAGAVGVGSYIKHKKQEKKASEILDEMCKQAEYSHNFNIPDDYDKYNIQDEIDFHNNFYESEGIKAPKFGKDLFPIAGNGGGDSYVVDKRNGKPTLKFFNHEEPEKLQELSKGEKIDFGLVKFKPSERQRKLLNEGITSDKAVDSLKRSQLQSFAPKKKDINAKNEAIENALLPPTAGFFIGTGIAAKKKLPEKQMAKAGLAGLALGTGVSLLANSKRKKDADNSLKKELKDDVWELQHRGVIKEKKASEVLEELYKEATTALGPVDWGKQKTIPLNSSEFKVRDAKLGEAIGHNAKQGAKAIGKAGAKAGKKGVDFAKDYGKLVKKAPRLAAIPAVAGLATANTIHQYKKRDKDRDNDTKTDAIKDKVIPEGVRSMKTIPISMAGAATGVLIGPRVGMKLGGRLGNKVALKAGLKGEKAMKAIGGAMAAGGTAGILAPTIASGAIANEMKKRDSLKRLDKLSNKYLGRDATEAEKKKIANNYKFGRRKHDITPESEVQKRRRAKAKREKKASDILNEMYKEASGDKVGKWTNKDKKGFVRNMAINVAQDFVNAGNPLNVGSHIVGSVMDSALMEGMTMKMNKKLQAQKISEKNMRHFNDAKGLSNGTTAVKAVKSTPGAVKKITSSGNN